MKTVTGARNHAGLTIFILTAALTLALPCTSAAGWTGNFRVTDTFARLSPGDRNLAYMPDGNLHLVYNADFNGNYEVCYRKLGEMGWSEQERLTFDPACSSGECIAAGAYGRIHVFWHDYRHGATELYYKGFNGSSWGSEERLTNAAGASDNPSAAVDQSGGIHLVWVDSRDGRSRIYYKVFDGAVWSTDIALSSDSTGVGPPSIACGPGGMVHVVWHGSPKYAYDNEIYYKMFDGSAWTDDIRITYFVGNSSDPCVAVDNLGAVHVVWCDYRAGAHQIYYKKFDGVVWSADYRLSVGGSSHPSIKTDSGGQIHVAWSGLHEGSPEIYYRLYSGDDWSEAERISYATDRVRHPALAIGEGGTVQIVWNEEHRDGYWGVSWKRSFDGDLPKPEIVSVEPSSGFSGEPVNIAEIAGTGIEFPAWVWLAKGGEADVRAQGLRLLPGGSITCTVDLEGVQLGSWDVTVENPDGKTDTLASAFEVMPMRIWEDDVRLTEDAAGSYAGAGNCMASDMAGNIHVVWTDERDGMRQVYYRLNDGTHWYPPERLANSSRNTWEPVVAADALGHVHVVWYEHRGSSYDICYRRRSAQGWDPVVWLTGNVGMSLYPAVTADGDGNVYVAWSNNRYGNFEIYARIFDGSAWGKPTRLSLTSAYSTHPVLATGPDGNIHLAWQEKHNLGSEIIYRMYDGDRWGPSERLIDDSKEVQDPSLCVAPDGSIHLVWSYGSGGGSILYEMVKDQTGWHEEVRVTYEKWAKACHPSVVAEGGGRIHVVWEDRRSQEHPGWPEPEIYWKTWDGDLWGSEERITSGPGDAGKPSVAADPAGNIHIVYQDDRDGNYEIYYTRRPSACGPAPVITESHPGKASNMSRVAVDIFGADFREDALVWLEKPGEPNRKAGSTEKVSPSHVKSEFRLSGAATGPWDLHLKNPDLQHAVLADAITVFDTPWGEETRVSFDPAGSATPRNNCRAVIREDGGVIHVVWQDARHGDNEIYYRRWDGSAWGAETRLTEATGNSRDASIVRGPDGSLHVCWNDDRDGAWEVYYKRFDGQSWGGDLRLSPDDGFRSEFPCLTVDASGNPFVFYGDTRHGPWQIYCSRWDGRMQVEEWVQDRLTATDANARYPTATSDSRGRVYVFWADRREGDFHIYSDRWTGSSWKGNWRLPCDPGMLVNPTCACDNLGRVMVVWRDDFYPCRLLAMVKDGSWVDTGPIATWDKDPNLCCDGQGRFHLVYDLHFDNIVAYRTYSDSWSGVTEVNWAVEAVKPFVAADAHGHVAVVWKDTRDRNSEIYLRRWEGDVGISGVAQAGAGDPEFGLALVSPNPAVGSVRMQFALATRDDARLSVFDIRGRLVWSEDFARPGTGMHSVIWDCSDQSGRSVAPGVYLLRLDSGRRFASAKVVILR